jgi:DNA invertase Pin-like site-specific DNA recombinase
MVYAYLRQLTESNSLSQQQQHILSYAMTHSLQIDKEVMEYSGINHTIEDREKFEAFIHSLKEDDCIITQNLSILSCHTEEIIKIINCILSHKVTLYITNAKIRIHRETAIADVFPLLNALNEEQKEKHNQIGRPKGSRSSSKFDTFQPRIIELLKEKMSVSAISRELGVSRSSLKDYIESRELRRLIDKSWIEVSQTKKEAENPYTLLICPFEKNKNKETDYE